VAYEIAGEPAPAGWITRALASRFAGATRAAPPGSSTAAFRKKQRGTTAGQAGQPAKRPLTKRFNYIIRNRCLAALLGRVFALAAKEGPASYLAGPSQIAAKREGQAAIAIYHVKPTGYDVLGRLARLHAQLLPIARGLSGIALARQAQAMRPGLLVLLTTGYAGMGTASTDEFPIILKPFGAAELGRTIVRMIGRSPRENPVAKLNRHSKRSRVGAGRSLKMRN
jgi:hypothetical protein